MMTTVSKIDRAALAGQLRMHVMRLSRRLRAEREPSDRTLSQLAALATVARLGPITPGELAAQERVQPPSMSRIIARLEEAGLIERSAHPTDGRQSLLGITEAGSALLSANRKRRDEWLARQLAALSAEDVATLAAAVPLLERLEQA